MAKVRPEFPPSKSIKKEVDKIVAKNMNFTYVHARKNLEDLITDLIKYKDSLPSEEDYVIEKLRKNKSK